MLTGNQVRFEAWGKPTEYSGTISVDAFKAAKVHDISPDLNGKYAALNRSVGALIGVRKGDTIVWEHGPITMIPTEDERNAYRPGSIDPWLVK